MNSIIKYFTKNKLKSRIYKENNKILINDKEKDMKTKISNNQIYYILDFETSGLDTDKDDIIEASVLRVEYNDNFPISTTNEYHKLFYSENSDNTFKFHRIPNEQLVGKDKYFESEKCKKYFSELLLKCTNENVYLAGQYLPFELAWLKRYFGDTIEWNKVNIYDTWSVERCIYPKKKHGSISICDRRGIKIDFNRNHRSGYDVLLTNKIIKSQREQLQELFN